MVAAASKKRFPLFEKYEVLEELGHGGMATVYRAKDRRLGREVAIKVMHPHLRESLEIAHRFFVEARAVAMLKHPNIVEVYDVSSEEDEERFLVVELIRGTTLRKILSDRKSLPPEVAAAVIAEVLSALAHAHAEGVIHRDIKPENVLVEVLQRSGDVDALPNVRVKLTDFGIAKLLDAQGVTSTGQVLGSPAHMAPEQIEGGEVDARADLFGMGVLLYESMVGHLPFQGANPAQVLRRVLDGIYPSADHELPLIGGIWSALVDRSLAPKAEDRFADAAAMKEAILAELARLGVASPKTEVAAFFRDPARYEREHHERMKTRLPDLAARARRAGNVLAGASDYNRALAYSPNDPKLLRLVSTMHRSDRRKKALGAMLPLVGAGAVATLVSYFGWDAWLGRAARSTPAVLAVHDPPDGLSPPRPSSIPARVEVAPTPRGVQAVPIAAVPSLVAVRPVVTHVSSRSVMLSAVMPRFGVKVAVDDAPAGDARAGFQLTVDARPHRLSFSCIRDICEPETRFLPAGDQDQTLDVKLRIKPAYVTVFGPPNRMYQLNSDAESASVSIGVANKVTFTDRGEKTVTVLELGSGRQQTVKVFAGESKQVRFELEL